MQQDDPTARSIWLCDETPTDFRPWMEPYLVDTPTPRGAVLVCPGGGYAGRSSREAVPVAERFNRGGLHAFVVNYSVAPRRFPQGLIDLSRAVRLVRARSDEWNVDPDKIAVCGFSAGGHLAASLAVHYDLDVLRDSDDLQGQSNRPDAAVLCYPVITSGRYANQGTFRNLLGEPASEDMLSLASLENHVTASTPPAFIWHTMDDSVVPVENSLLFAQAMSAAGVPFELHVFPHGPHGLSLAAQETATEGAPPPDPHVATWSELCVQWLHGLGF